MTPMYKVLKWAMDEGPPKTIDRIQLRTLGMAMAEGINLKSLSPTSNCSPELLEEYRKVSSELIGKPCPV